jgi:hypothetical protein
MNIGLIDVDQYNKVAKFPNIALMKISAWHKAQGHNVEPWFGFNHYDRVYISKVFDNTYTEDFPFCINADEIYKGGTGYVLRDEDGTLRIFHDGEWIEVSGPEQMVYGNTTYTEFLPNEVEHIYPDYSLYPELTKDTAFGFLTRGCPRGCHFCIVAGKEGRRTVKVADVSEWWSGQKNIVLCDPNLLACKGHMELLQQLADSKAWVDINQGIDCRLLTERNIEAINNLKLKEIHFAWDYMHEEKRVLSGLELYAKMATRKPHGQLGTVYCLTNYDTTMDENLYRIYKLRDMGYDPYVMIYDKPHAPREVRLLQRWCNNRLIFRAEPDFHKYNPKRG